MLAAALGAAAAAPATRGASHRRRLGEDDDGLTEIDLSKIEGSKEHVRRILTHYDELLASGECIYGEFTNEVTMAPQMRGWRGSLPAVWGANGRTNSPNLPESQWGSPPDPVTGAPHTTGGGIDDGCVWQGGMGGGDGG